MQLIVGSIKSYHKYYLMNRYAIEWPAFTVQEFCKPFARIDFTNAFMEAIQISVPILKS